MQYITILYHIFSFIVAYFRPGAGKSTIADKVVGLLNDNGYTSAASSIRQCDDTKHHEYLALDLDVCVSQTMRVSLYKRVYRIIHYNQIYILQLVIKS